MSTGAIYFDILQIFVIQKVKDDWKKIHVCSISTSASSEVSELDMLLMDGLQW
jgi:hypothetical protein